MAFILSLASPAPAQADALDAPYGIPPLLAAPCLPATFGQARAFTETVAGCFESEATRGPVHYEVTFPAGYDPAERQPYAIFLHGRGGNEAQFRDFGGAVALDDHVKRGGAGFVVISPGEPKHSYWKDGPAGEFGTAKMITEDLVRHIESMPGIARGDRARRAIMGISMGGHGSFYLAEKRPDLFSSLYAMSPVFRGADELLEEDTAAFGSAAKFNEQDPVGLYLDRQGRALNPLPKVKSAVEIGKDDWFLQSSPRTLQFIEKLKSDMGADSVNLSRPGGHDVDYWRGAFQRAADFVGDNFPAEKKPSRGPAAKKKSCADEFGTI
jgi:S-formylglutathione hydrolase FrmB